VRVGGRKWQFVTQYSISHSMDKKSWTHVDRVFDGPSFPDSLRVVVGYIHPAVWARFVRLHVVSYQNWPCLRADILGPYEDLHRFYMGAMLPQRIIGHFETAASKSTPEGLYFNRLDFEAHPLSVVFRATVGGGDCGAHVGEAGARAAIEFQLAWPGIEYFKNGVQGGWQPLIDPTLVAGNLGMPMPTHIWTGNGEHTGWIIGSPDMVAFATGQDVDPLHPFWNRCNGSPLNGGEIAELSIRYKTYEVGSIVEAVSEGPRDFVVAYSRHCGPSKPIGIQTPHPFDCMFAVATTRPDCSQAFVNFVPLENSTDNCFCVDAGVDCWDPARQHFHGPSTIYSVRAIAFAPARIVKVLQDRRRYVVEWDSGRPEGTLVELRHIRPRAFNYYRARWICFSNCATPPLVFYCLRWSVGRTRLWPLVFAFMPVWALGVAVGFLSWRFQYRIFF